MNQEKKNEKISIHHYLLVDEPLFPRQMVGQRVPVTPLDRHSVITVLRSAKKTKNPFVDEWVTYMLNKGRFALYYGEEWLGIPDDYKMEKFIREWRPTQDEARGINMRNICGKDAPNAQMNRAVELVIEKDPVMEVKVDPPQGEICEIKAEETLLIGEEPQGDIVDAQEVDRVMTIVKDWFPEPDVQLSTFLPKVEPYDDGKFRADRWAEIPEGALVTACAIEGRIYGINAQGEMLSRDWEGPSSMLGEVVWGKEIVFVDLWYKGASLGGRTLAERMSYLDGTDVRRVTYKHVQDCPEGFSPGVVMRHGRRAIFRNRPRAMVVRLSDVPLRVQVREREAEGYAVCPEFPALRLSVDGVFFPVEGWNGDQDIMVEVRNGVFRQLCHGWTAYSYASQRDVDAASRRDWQKYLPRMRRLSQWWREVLEEPPPLEEKGQKRSGEGPGGGCARVGGPSSRKIERSRGGVQVAELEQQQQRGKGAGKTPPVRRGTRTGQGTRGRPARGRSDKMRVK